MIRGVGWGPRCLGSTLAGGGRAESPDAWVLCPPSHIPPPGLQEIPAAVVEARAGTTTHRKGKLRPWEPSQVPTPSRARSGREGETPGFSLQGEGEEGSLTVWWEPLRRSESWGELPCSRDICFRTSEATILLSRI